MAKKGRSEQGAFGTIYHYDANGKKIGKSEPGFGGSYINYDAKGKKIGRSNPGVLGRYNHYDAKGHKTGYSDPSSFGSYHHHDATGKRTGSSDPGMFGSYNHNDTQGCYIATCVYGSYDCPEVWTLRRFRDDVLSFKKIGQLFIKVYYSISPTIVKAFGHSRWFKSIWKKVLDYLIQRLNESGIENTPYYDP